MVLLSRRGTTRSLTHFPRLKVKLKNLQQDGERFTYTYLHI